MTNIKKRKKNTFIAVSPTNHYCKKNTQIPGFTSQLIYAFLKKTHGTNLQFFLTFFDKINSENRCREMSNPMIESLFRVVCSLHISYKVVRNNSSGVTIMPILWYD